MGQGKSSEKAPPDQPGPPRKRKSVIEKVTGKVMKLANKLKKSKGDGPVKNLEDAGKYILKPGGQFGELQTTSKGEYITKDPEEPKKKRSVVGNMVHNVKKKMKPKWNDSNPEKDKVRKNHSELDDYVEKKKPQPQKPKPRQHKPKAYNQSDGVPDDPMYGGFAPEAGLFSGGFGHGGHGGDAGFGHGGDGGGGDGPNF